MYDICVIGGGPAGLTAALYSLRAGRSTLLMEEKTFGGQMAETSVIENMPGSTCCPNRMASSQPWASGEPGIFSMTLVSAI